MAEQAQELLRLGIAAAREGQKEQARALLQQAVRLDPGNETVWLWLSSVARDNQERVFCLRKLLSINPNSEPAVKGLRALGVSVQRPDQAASGVPVVSDQALARAQRALEELLARYAATPEPALGFEWVVKKRGRAGERGSVLFTVGVAAGAVALVGIVLVVLAALFVPQLQVALQPTATPTPPPPTLTPTPTAGPTNTPSATPRVSPTPSPTYLPQVPNGADAWGRLRFLTPTRVYFATQHAAVAEADNAARAYIARNYQEAINLSQRARASSPGQERGLLDTFFYEGMSHAALGNYEMAVDSLRRGLEWNDIALLNAGLGYAYYEMGRLQDSAAHNLKAILQDARLVLPVLTQADIYLASGQAADALDLVNRALAQPALLYDVNLIVKRGQAHLAAGNSEQALADAHLALYIDPLAESAYLLLARTRLSRGEYGMAVLDLQDYLFYFPGSILGWTLLGEARYREGNLQAALAAYDQALAANARSAEELQAYLSRGSIYLARGLYPQAFADLDAALAIADDVQARQGRARAAFEIGRYDVARQDAEAVLAAQPDNPSMQLLLGQSLVMLGEYARGRAALEAALPQGLDRAEEGAAYEYLARALYHLAEREALAGTSPRAAAGDLSVALEAIDRALAIEATGSRYYYRGRIRELAGEAALAKADYEWVLAWGDVYGYPFVGEARGRLDVVASLLTPAPSPTPSP